MAKKQAKEQKIKIAPTKGRPMLNWVGKKPLDYVKGYPAVLMEAFDPLKTGLKYDIPRFEDLKKNWQNLLFYGDNKEVLATLLEQGFRGKIDLIYIDPPFKSGTDYVRKVELRGLKEIGTDVDDADLLQQTMYFDMWNNDTYLQFMYERLILLKELLAETGSIYIHLDWHVGHYVKLLMDEVFGQDNLRNEIIWCYTGASEAEDRFPAKHDTILFYAKSSKTSFNCDAIRVPYKNGSKNLQYGKMDFMKKPFRTKCLDWFSDIPSFMTASQSKEKLRYQTQKPEKLLERIIKASSNAGDIVLDCFIGSGTTARVAQKLSRKWIGCDINKGAIQITSRELQKLLKSRLKRKRQNIHLLSNL